MFGPWWRAAVVILLVSLTDAALDNLQNKRNVTAMDAVVEANTKQDSLTNGTDDVTDDIILPAMTSSAGSQEYSAAIRPKRNLWPNGRINYKMSRDITRRPSHMRIIKAAMAEWERNTCIRFINRTNDPAHREYVYIHYGTGCRGSVGRWKGTKSRLSLGKWCDNFKVVLHELGHTLGYFHEQNRPDRDKYVTVLWNNIDPKWAWAFNKKRRRLVNSRGMPYDYNSIMHYGSHLFSINGKPTLKSRDPSVKYLGNTGLSLMDIKQTNILYNCIDFPNFPRDFYFTKGGSQSSSHCITMTEPNDPLWKNTTICYNKDKRDIRFRWSNSGPLPSMNCTNTAMPDRRSYARFWQDNYICVPRDSVLKFGWSVSGPIKGMKCTGIRVHAGSPYLYHLCATRTDEKITDNQKGSNYTSWSPWQRCSKDCEGGIQSRFRDCKRGRVCHESLVDTRFCNNHKCLSWPHWPSDFQYHVGYIKPIHSCVRIFERNQYTMWLKNWFCWKIMRRRKLKILWSDMNEVPGMWCTYISEPREKKNSGWDNNYLCVQQDAPYRFQWSSNGTIKGQQCVKWMGKGGKDGWDDNYLCADEYPEKTACPDGWVVNRTKTNDFCYRMESKALTWPAAQTACENHKANLLSIRSQEEFEFVKDKVQKGMSVWIGANDRKTEGVWQWTDGSNVTLANWDSGEPNNGQYRRDEHCVLLRFDGKWNDFPCETYPFSYICKKVIPRI